METSPDPFGEFIRQLDPLLHSRRLPSRRNSLPVYGCLDFSCVAAKHLEEWILVSGRAHLWVERSEIKPQPEKVAALGNLVAFDGRIPAGEFEALVSDLRSSWVLKRENVRILENGVGGYIWTLPRIVRWPLLYYQRELQLYGVGPDLSSVLDYSTLQNIDSQLRVGAPGFNGFDGLCANLWLPARRSNLKSSFRLSADLPAEICSVDFFPSKCTLDLKISSLGTPDIMVDWLPEHEFQKIPVEWMTNVVGGVPGGASIPVPNRDHAGAKLILSFGELEADIVLIDFTDHIRNRKETGPIPLALEREDLDFFELPPEVVVDQAYRKRKPTGTDVGGERDQTEDVAGVPTVPDLMGRRGRYQQPPSAVEVRKGPSQKLPTFNYRSAIKDAILTALTRFPNATDLEICRFLDARGDAEIPVSWQKGKNRSFNDAYRDPELRHRIEVRISQVRADRRKR